MWYILFLITLINAQGIPSPTPPTPPPRRCEDSSASRQRCLVETISTVAHGHFCLFCVYPNQTTVCIPAWCTTNITWRALECESYATRPRYQITRCISASQLGVWFAIFFYLYFSVSCMVPWANINNCAPWFYQGVAFITILIWVAIFSIIIWIADMDYRDHIKGVMVVSILPVLGVCGLVVEAVVNSERQVAVSVLTFILIVGTWIWLLVHEQHDDDAW